MADENVKEGLGFNPFESSPLTAPGKQNPDYDPTSMSNDFSGVIDQMMNTSLEDMIASHSAPSTVGPSKAGYTNPDAVEKYIHQDDFNPVGFNPNDPTNYDRWVAKETWGTSLAKGFDSFATRFGNTFTDYWKDYGRMFNALAHFDSDKLLPDEEEMAILNRAEHVSSMENYVFVPEDVEDDIFSRKSISEFIGNAGFALGTMSALSLELAADALITIATEGAGSASFGATFSRLSAKGGLKLWSKSGRQVFKKTLKETPELIAKKKARESAGREAAKGSVVGDFFKSSGTAIDNPVMKTMKTAEGIADVASNPGLKREFMNQLGGLFNRNTKELFKSKSFAEWAGKAVEHIPLVGTAAKSGKRIAQGAKAGESFGTLLGMGYRGIRRLGQEYNLAATEASFEAISSYGDTLDKMIHQHIIDTGKSPTAEELQEMKHYANEASFANYGTNLAILLATNQLQFGNIFNRFTPANKYMREILKDASGGSNLLKVNRMWASSPLKGKAYKKGFWGTYGLAPQIARDFGKKQAVYEVAKQFGKGFTRFEISEGLQENLQEMSNSAWRNYYAGKVNGIEYTLDEAFGEGASEQFTKQGFKTFLQGALTGSFIRIPVTLIQKGTQGIQKAGMSEANKQAVKDADEKLIDNINTLNSFLQSMSDKKFDEQLFNFNVQAGSAMDMTEAAAQGSEYDFINGKDNALLNAAIMANRMGTVDMLINGIREMGVDMTAEEFKETFNIDLKDTKYNNPQEFTETVASDIAGYSETVDKVRKNVQNKLMDPYVYEEDSQDRVLATIVRSAQDDAITMIAFNEMKAQRFSERAESVVNDYNSIESLANSSDYVYRVLSNPKTLMSEVDNIEADRKILVDNLKTEGLDAKQKKDLQDQIKRKDKELKLLEKWLGFWSGEIKMIKHETEEGEVEMPEVKINEFIGKTFKSKKRDSDPMHKDVRKVFKDLVSLKNEETGVGGKISNADLESGFDKVVDFMKLDKDARSYMESVEALHSPEEFQKTYKRMLDGKYKRNILQYIDFLERGIGTTVNDILKEKGIININLDSEDKPIMSVDPNKTDKDLKHYQQIEKDITEAVTSSEAYKNLLNAALNNKIGFDQNKHVREQMEEIDKILKEQYKAFVKDIAPGVQFDEVISNKDYASFVNDKEVSDTILDDIAQRLFEYKGDPDTLSKRQKEIREAKRSEVQARVDKLKKEAETAEKSEAEKNAEKTDTNEKQKDEAEEEVIDSPVPPVAETAPPVDTDPDIEVDIEKERSRELTNIENKASDIQNEYMRFLELSAEGVAEAYKVDGKYLLKEEHDGLPDNKKVSPTPIEDVLEDLQDQIDAIIGQKKDITKDLAEPVEKPLPEGYRYVEEGEVLPAGDYDTHIPVDGSKAITNAPKKEEVKPEEVSEAPNSEVVTEEQFNEFKSQQVIEDRGYIVQTTEDGKFEVVTPEGSVLEKYDTEQEAKEVIDESLKVKQDYPFIVELLKNAGVSSKKIDAAIKGRIYDIVQEKIDKYNQKIKKEENKARGIKDFYDRTKQNRNDVHKAINKLIKENPFIIAAAPEVEVKSPEVKAKPTDTNDPAEAKQDVKDSADKIRNLAHRLRGDAKADIEQRRREELDWSNKEALSLMKRLEADYPDVPTAGVSYDVSIDLYKEAINAKYDTELAALRKPAAVDSLGQGVLFPEEIGKFESEESLLEDLDNIEFSCE